MMPFTNNLGIDQPKRNKMKTPANVTRAIKNYGEQTCRTAYGDSEINNSRAASAFDAYRNAIS